MTNRTPRLIALASVAALAIGGSAGTATSFAKHGADDPPGHNRNDDRGGKGKAKHRRVHARRENELRHGADDPVGHVRHGGDDGPNHG